MRNLLQGGTSVVLILGGAHDLTDNIERLAEEEVRFMSVATRAYEDIAAQQK